ncbi:hypothetical protein, variant [Batrachochytrium dendrobatidis JEL423]|uniref:S1/P1 Nuclease n=1 Tax=Batrachochytrium dendrobatidis (strain JEL423) TaxID=403673 RepID=A0A177WWM1_BATDL|nr:hypothetical protein, variant [Batrachochytrium dendrobatidis JEL423]
MYSDYINTNDNPPKNCSFDDMRDCKDGRCLVGAIAKYTNEFLCSKKTSLLDKGIALKFLVHFIGDLSQPLHVSGREYGGHKTQVKYRGRSVTLHSIFDHHIPKGRIRNFNGSEYHYTDYLVRVIHQEQNKGLHTSWLTSYNVFDQSKLGNSMAAIDFARDSNRLSCTGIWSAYDANPRQDFSYQYYRYGSTLVDRQLAKAGYRLAFWINQLSLMTQDDQYCLSASLRLPILYSVWLGLAIQVMFMLVF